MIRLWLPWPPSVNAMYRAVRGRSILSARGREYQDAAAAALLLQRPGRMPDGVQLRMTIIAHEPDKRRRDADNLIKGPQDCLTKAGIYRDDSLIRDLRIAFADRVPDGRLDITISPLEVSHDQA